MDTGNDRLRNIIRETQNISETSSSSNTFNIQSIMKTVISIYGLI